MCLQSVGQEDPLEEGMADHPSILAWRIPWTEEPTGYSPWGSQKSQIWLKWLSMHAHAELRSHMPSGMAKRSKTIATIITHFKNHKHISVITDSHPVVVVVGAVNRYPINTQGTICVYTACHRRAEAFKSSGQDGLKTRYLSTNQPPSGEVEALMGNEGRMCPGGKTSTHQGSELGRSLQGQGGWRGKSKNSMGPGEVRTPGRHFEALSFPWIGVKGLRTEQRAPIHPRNKKILSCSYWVRILEDQGGSQGKSLAALRCLAIVTVAGTSVVCAEMVKKLGSRTLWRSRQQDFL